MTINYRENLCPLPWIHFSANADTSVRICCNTYHGGHIRNDENEVAYADSSESLANIYNKKTYRDIRKAMLKGEKPSFCDSCYNGEKNGAYSIRENYYDRYSHLVEEFIQTTNPEGDIIADQIKIREIDFALSNNCNLKCRMCTPSCSTSLKKEFDDLGLGYNQDEFFQASRSWTKNEAIRSIIDDQSDNILNILTTGGEPFISLEHREHLKILKAKNLHSGIKLSYHTSLTKLPAELTQLWLGFKEVRIHVSLEGIGEVNNYARYPSKWDDIAKNFHILNKLSKLIPMKISIHSCIQALTWVRQHELIYFSAQLAKDFSALTCMPAPIWLETPWEMSAMNLPKELIQLGISRLEVALEEVKNTHTLDVMSEAYYQTSQSIIKRLNEVVFDQNKFDAFRQRVITVDEYRSQNIVSVMPEFEPWFNVKEVEILQNTKRLSELQDKIKEAQTLAYKHLLHGDFQQALNYFQFLSQHTDDIDSLYNYGFCHKNLNLKDEAISIFKKVLNLDPDNYYSLIEVACYEMEMKNYDYAMELFLKAHTNAPEEKLPLTNELILKCHSLNKA